ncbi:MAG: glycosyltransferase family 2 protein, partial [Acidimicrobiales bacterium]
FCAARLDYVFFTDADNQFDIEELALLLAWVDRADVVAGFRKVRHAPFMRRLNAWGWNRLVRLLFYVPVRDIDCAFKLFRRTVLERIDIESRGAMINTEIMVKLARGGSAIVEVGVTHFPRTAGSPQGAKLRVIARAMREARKMYPGLSKLVPSVPEPAVNGHNVVGGGRVAVSGWTLPTERHGTFVASSSDDGASSPQNGIPGQAREGATLSRRRVLRRGTEARKARA